MDELSKVEQRLKEYVKEREEVLNEKLEGISQWQTKHIDKHEANDTNTALLLNKVFMKVEFIEKASKENAKKKESEAKAKFTRMAWQVGLIITFFTFFIDKLLKILKII